MTHENVIEMREITKIFGQFVANDKINLHLRRGEIHALLGENGAGKSTLMNMLAGLLEPTSGEIAVNGQVVKLDSPSKAASLGIGKMCIRDSNWDTTEKIFPYLDRESYSLAFPSSVGGGRKHGKVKAIIFQAPTLIDEDEYHDCLLYTSRCV